ncbi:MAG: MFS transporter [Candidatus Marinimicrobia bacterium]|nr:MFS transporter [Candidatus Neomarinimicrobiota bacterium]
MTESQKLSIKEKVGYSLGDSAANFVFQAAMMFLMYFYTDVFGLPAGVAGTLFLLARMWDAITDPIMGAISDRTNTKWGKFRPWVLWTAAPFGLIFFVTFTTPNLSLTGKIIYAYVTYFLLWTVYTANNIPYSAMTGVLTSSIEERASLASYRFFFAMSAALLVQGFGRKLVDLFGQGNEAKGFQMTIGLLSIIAVVFFIITFLTTKERVKPNPKQKSSLKQDVKDLLDNKPWMALFVLTIFVFISLSLRGSVTLYYFKYYVGNPKYFDTFNILGNVATLIGIFFTKKFSLLYGKRNTFRVCLFITATMIFLFIFLPPEAITIMFILQVIAQFSYGITIPMLWAMMADVADYSEWRKGRRATGIAFSAATFGLKFGLGVGGAISGWLLSLFGYVPNIEQTEKALLGIKMLMSVFPAAAFYVGVVALFFYGISKEMMKQIERDLEERRKSFAEV